MECRYSIVSLFTGMWFVLGFLFLSCESNKGMEDLDPLNPGDTTSIEENFNCESNPEIHLAFNYQDSFYQISDPSVRVFIDTLTGSKYALPDSLQFFRKFIVIEAPLSDHEAIHITIEEVLEPHAVCLPLKVYHEFDYSNYENGLIDCYLPNPMNTEMSIPLCSSTTISRKTVHENGVGYSYSAEGSLEVNECMEGTVSGVFSNEFFTNGWFCSIDVNWQ